MKLNDFAELMRKLQPNIKLRRNLMNTLLVGQDKKSSYAHSEGGVPYVSFHRIEKMIYEFNH